VYDNESLVRLGDQMLENYLKVFHMPKEKRLISDIWKSRDRIDARDYLSLISILLVRLLRLYHREVMTTLRLIM
jgi:hypothetical protein